MFALPVMLQQVTELEAVVYASLSDSSNGMLTLEMQRRTVSYSRRDGKRLGDYYNSFFDFTKLPD